MKNEYPNYYKTILRQRGKIASKVAQLEKNINAKDKKIMNDFLDYCKITSKSFHASSIRKRTMLHFCDVVEKSLSKLTLKDVRDILMLINNSTLSPATQNDIKALLKRFLRWYYKDWNERFDELRDFKMKDERNHKKINPTALLKPEEFELFVKKSESLRYKALIMLMYESGGRPEEILKLRWTDINLEDKKVKLDSGKTGQTRVNEIERSVLRLKAYKQEYPFPNVTDNDLVFPSPRDRNRKITSSTLSLYFSNLGKRAGIKKHIWPYLLRHTRLTPLIQELSPKAYERFAGHALETGMYYYGHLSDEAISQEIREKVYPEDEMNLIPEETPKLRKEMDSLKKELESLKKLIFEKNDLETDMYITQNSEATGEIIISSRVL